MVMETYLILATGKANRRYAIRPCPKGQMDLLPFRGVFGYGRGKPRRTK